MIRRHLSLIGEARETAGVSPSFRQIQIDPSTIAARNRARFYVRSLTIDHSATTGGPDPLAVGYRDAADECPHGALPGDRVVRCACWTQLEAAA